MATAIKKIKKFDLASLDQIENDLLASISGFAKARGIEVSNAGGGQYLEDQFIMRVKMTVFGARRKEYLRMAKTYKLKPEWLDQTFVYKDGKTYKIVGLDERSRFSVQTKQVGGRTSHPSDFAVEAIKKYMK